MYMCLLWSIDECSMYVQAYNKCTYIYTTVVCLYYYLYYYLYYMYTTEAPQTPLASYCLLWSLDDVTLATR